MNVLPAGSDTAKKVVLAAFVLIFLAPSARVQNQSPLISPGATSSVVRPKRAHIQFARHRLHAPVGSLVSFAAVVVSIFCSVRSALAANVSR